jgi:hypothetical protein
MNYRRIMGLIGAAGAGAGAIGTEVAQAQDDLGDSIANTVSGAVASISTSSGGDVSGGTSVRSDTIQLGEQEGVAISDASGGNNNVSFVS